MDFNKIVERRNTDCLKFDAAVRRGYPADILPLWVADMDFPTAQPVLEALHPRTNHGVFGYTEADPDRFFSVLQGWFLAQHQWEIQKEWLLQTPGVVFALAMAVKAYTQPGDAVLIQQPVYYPFSEVIEDNKRVIVSNDLVLGDDNRYHIDFEVFEKKIVENNIKLFFLCNPQNPTGRVFTKEELTKLGDICLKHEVLVVSDEIHNDFALYGEHTVFAKVKKEFEDNCIICTSASKTFNLASMLMSNIFIPNQKIRRAFKKQIDAAGISQLSILGIVATRTAYEKGEEWYENVISYIKENIAYLKKYTEENLPGVKVIDGEGTFLPWLDFRGTGLSSEEIDKRIIYDAKLWLDSGRIFGKVGDGFQRINVATPRSILEECLRRIRKYVVDNN